MMGYHNSTVSNDRHDGKISLFRQRTPEAKPWQGVIYVLATNVGLDNRDNASCIVASY